MMDRKTKIRYNSCRHYEPGTVFVEADGFYTVTACVSEKTLDPNLRRLQHWTIKLEGMTAEEELIYEIMSK